MRFAVDVPSGGECASPAALAELARVAEAARWDAMLLEDYLWYHNATYHSTPDVPTYDPWIGLAAIALQTTRLRLSTSVTPLSRWRPWHLARVAVSLDHLSGGRLILGVGLGDLADRGFTHVGEATEPRERATRLDEGLAILTGLWRGEPFAFAGEAYRVQEVTFCPTPLQQPTIPIWVGGSARTPAVIRRAARYQGICPYKLPGTDDWDDFTPDDVRAAGGDRRAPDRRHAVRRRPGGPPARRGLGSGPDVDRVAGGGGGHLVAGMGAGRGLRNHACRDCPRSPEAARLATGAWADREIGSARPGLDMSVAVTPLTVEYKRTGDEGGTGTEV